MQPRFIGDVLLCTPAVRALRQTFPDSRITFLTEPAGAGALVGNPYLDEVREWSPRENALGLGLRLRGRYDTVLDFRSTPSTSQVAWLSGARRRIGVWTSSPWGRLYTHLTPRGGNEYVARQKLRLLEPLGVDVDAIEDVSLDLIVSERERRRAAEIWARTGLDEYEAVVAVSPVSRIDYKQWGLDRWRAVVAELRGAGLGVLVTSGPGERADAAAVAAGSGAVWDYGATRLPELAALYARCILWVGNDGGPKHVAVAAGVPTFTVIRWQLGTEWTDPAKMHGFIEQAPPGGCDLRCARCEHLGCLNAISVEEVADRVRGALTRVGKP